MTDARLPESLLMDRNVNSLPAEAWRSYTHSLMWSVSNRTDGIILTGELGMIPMFRAGDENILEKAGLWTRLDHVWKINRFELEQTTRAQLEANERTRLLDRERQRRSRQHDRGDHSECKPKYCEKAGAGGPGPGGGVTGDVTRDVTVDFPGQDRTGQDRMNTPPAENFNPETGEVFDAPSSSAPADAQVLPESSTKPSLSVVPNPYTDHADAFDEFVSQGQEELSPMAQSLVDAFAFEEKHRRSS